jgi:hypothetical protein
MWEQPMMYRIEFVHNRSVFFAFSFGSEERRDALQDMARNIIKGYFGDSREPRPIEPHPVIADLIQIKDESDAKIVASWSLRQEFIERRKQRETV